MKLITVLLLLASAVSAGDEKPITIPINIPAQYWHYPEYPHAPKSPQYTYPPREGNRVAISFGKRDGLKLTNNKRSESATSQVNPSEESTPNPGSQTPPDQQAAVAAYYAPCEDPKAQQYITAAEAFIAGLVKDEEAAMFIDQLALFYANGCDPASIPWTLEYPDENTQSTSVVITQPSSQGGGSTAVVVTPSDPTAQNPSNSIVVTTPADSTPQNPSNANAPAAQNPTTVVVNPPAPAAQNPSAVVVAPANPAPQNPSIVVVTPADPASQSQSTVVVTPADPASQSQSTVVITPADPASQSQSTVVITPADSPAGNPSTVVVAPADPAPQNPSTVVVPPAPANPAPQTDPNVVIVSPPNPSTRNPSNGAATAPQAPNLVQSVTGTSKRSVPEYGKVQWSNSTERAPRPPKVKLPAQVSSKVKGQGKIGNITQAAATNATQPPTKGNSKGKSGSKLSGPKLDTVLQNATQNADVPSVQVPSSDLPSPVKNAVAAPPKIPGKTWNNIDSDPHTPGLQIPVNIGPTGQPGVLTLQSSKGKEGFDASFKPSTGAATQQTNQGQGVTIPSNKVSVPDSSTVYTAPSDSKVIIVPESSEVVQAPGNSNVVSVPPSSSIAQAPADSNVIAIRDAATQVVSSANNTVTSAVDNVTMTPEGTQIVSVPGDHSVIAAPGDAQVVAVPNNSETTPSS
jgi:hypothetical protein